MGGCATVVRGTHAPYRITSTPDGARVALSSGETCITPCVLDLPRANAFRVRVSKLGYITQTLEVTSKPSGAGAVGLLANGVIGGIAGVGADVDSGALRSLSPNPLVVKLERSAQPN